MEWKHFNVHLRWPDGVKEKICVTALNKEDSKADTRIAKAIQAGAEVKKVIGPLGIHLATAKQNLAHHYRSCIGAATMVSKNCEFARQIIYNVNKPESVTQAEKIQKAHQLVLSQCAKLQRDIRDLFKLAGLKVK